MVVVFAVALAAVVLLSVVGMARRHTRGGYLDGWSRLRLNSREIRRDGQVIHATQAARQPDDEWTFRRHLG